MYKDQRTFHAIAFVAPKVDGLDKCISFLPRTLVSDMKYLTESTDDFVIAHCYFHRNKRYRTTPDSYDFSGIKSKRYGKTTFGYDMYLMFSKSYPKSLTIIAVPLLEMAYEVFPLIHKAARGQSLLYQTVNLEKLVPLISSKATHPQPIRINLVKFRVDADPEVETLTLGGPNVMRACPIHS